MNEKKKKNVSDNTSEGSSSDSTDVSSVGTHSASADDNAQGLSRHTILRKKSFGRCKIHPIRSDLPLGIRKRSEEASLVVVPEIGGRSDVARDKRAFIRSR